MADTETTKKPDPHKHLRGSKSHPHRQVSLGGTISPAGADIHIREFLEVNPEMEHQLNELNAYNRSNWSVTTY